MTRREEAGSLRLLAATLACLVLAAGWRASLSMPGVDFYQYWAVGQALLAGRGGDLYQPATGERLGREFVEETARTTTGPRQLRAAGERRTLEIFSTPLLYATFGVLASGDYERDYRRYQLLSLACGVIAIALLCRSLGYGFVGSALAVSAFGVPFEPSYSDAVVGNVNRVLLLGIAAFVLLQRTPGSRMRDALGGGVLMLTVLFKPTLAFAVGLLAISRVFERRFAKLALEGAGMAIAVVGVAIVSWLSLGTLALWQQWGEAVAHLLSVFPVPVAQGNFSPIQILLEATGANLSVPATIALASLLVVTLGVRARRMVGSSPALDASARDDAPARDALVLGAGLVAGLLFARLAWLHYFLLCAPLLLVLMRPGSSRPHAAAFGAALAWLLLSLQPFRLLESSDARVAAVMVAGGAALLLALAVGELLRSAPESVTAPGSGAPVAG